MKTTKDLYNMIEIYMTAVYIDHCLHLDCWYCPWDNCPKTVYHTCLECIERGAY